MIIGQPPFPIRARKAFVSFMELKSRDFSGMLTLNLIKEIVSDCLFIAIEASRLRAGEIRPDLFRLLPEGDAKGRGEQSGQCYHRIV